VISCAASPLKARFEASTRLFWSLLTSSSAGARTWNLSLSTLVLETAAAKDAAHSCRKITSTSKYCSSRMRRVRADLFVDSAEHSADFTACQEVGATALSMCTRTASKMAQQSACSGTLMASSSSVTAGYLARGILLSMLHGRIRFVVPPFAGISSSPLNMKAFHAAHHVGMSGRGAV